MDNLEAVAFEIIELGETYIDGLGSHFKITSYYPSTNHFQGFMVDGTDANLFGTMENYKPDGSIHDLFPCPSEHNLKYRVLP